MSYEMATILTDDLLDDGGIEEYIFNLSFEKEMICFTDNYNSQYLDCKFLPTPWQKYVTEKLYFHNYCFDILNQRRTFDIYLRFLKGEGGYCSQKDNNNDDIKNTIKSVDYSTFASLSLSEAKELSSVIAAMSNNKQQNISSLSYRDLDVTFEEKGTFQTVFQGVLDSKSINSLSVGINLNTDMDKHDCFGKSTLGTNTTLKKLELLSTNGSKTKHDKTMSDLARVLRTNQGLETIKIHTNIMTPIGRKYLLDSLDDNSTLLYMNTSSPNWYDMVLNENEDKCPRQLKIDRHMELNRLWKKYNIYTQRQRSSGKSIPIDLCPLLLEKFAEKPILLYKFLQKENNEFCNYHLYESHVERRNVSTIVISLLPSPLLRLIISLQSIYLSNKNDISIYMPNKKVVEEFLCVSILQIVVVSVLSTLERRLMEELNDT